MSTIDTIQLDALLSEKYVEPVITTQHPVEEGADPTDHARVLPGRLTLEAIITNTPIPEIDRTERGPAPQGRAGYAARQYRALQDLKNGRAVTVETATRTYKDMQITELAQSIDSKLGIDAVQFTVQLQKVIFVNTELVRLERVTAPTSIPKKPTNKTDQGKQGPIEEKDDGSQLKELFDNHIQVAGTWKGSGRGIPTKAPTP